MNRKPVITRRLADEDIDRAFKFYLTEGGSQLGIAFVDAYEHAALHLSRFPSSGSLSLELTLNIPGLRKWPMKRFPYQIIYFDLEHTVEIWRVLHGRVDIPAWLREKE